MITKRNGNGQTECRGCKEKGKFALTWDSFLYNFDEKPYCFNCLMEKLEHLHEENKILKQRIQKAIEYIRNNNVEVLKYYDEPSETTSYELVTIDLLLILEGSDK